MLKAQSSQGTATKSKQHNIIKEMGKYLSGAQLDFFRSQLKLSGVSRKGRRYSKTDKSFALSIYQRSLRAYKYLSKMFALSSSRMLR